MKKVFLIALFCFFATATQLNAQHYRFGENGFPELKEEGVSLFANLATKCILQEFPNKTAHIQSDSSDLKQPSEYHPSFYGCFDWHSSVHGHWMLVKLLKTFPHLPEAKNIRTCISRNITYENIKEEVRYFERKFSNSYERTYGWAWLLKLAEELHDWEDEEGKIWAEALHPLERLISEKYISYLPKQQYPSRIGTHGNTAFCLSFALDYARTKGDSLLEKTICERSLFYFEKDKNSPASWEPGSSDFFSPSLLEAELMSKVLSKEEYKRWLSDFLPDLEKGEPTGIFSPVSVSDRNDMQLIHLDGLNLSRAWCFLLIAKKTENTQLQNLLKKSAKEHLSATIPQIADGDYAGEHWLASFAVYALSIK